MRFFDDGILKDLSVEDMDQLRNEIKTLDRQVLAELESRERNCSYCGQRTGASLQGLKYCSAWHRYLDEHRDSAPLSRVEFERKRALHRIKTLRKAAEGNTPDSSGSSLGATAAMQVSLRNMKIRQVLDEYRIITGERLRRSPREQRESGNTGA
ncbi:MAG: hypothetical protein HXY20_10305 [Acidobacteria bacterium]|nr:hypothetical protein [Acidobacteriota bacterium]